MNARERSAIGLLLGMLAGPAALADESGVFTLQGDLSSIYASGNFVVWNPKKEGGRSAGAMMAPASGSQPTSLEASLDVLAKAPLGPDGTFRVEAAVDRPRQAFFYVLDAQDHEGRRLAPMKGNAFILEPGQLRLHMSRRGRFHIEGGRYNDAVYNVWRRSEPYMAAQAEYRRLLVSPAEESESAKRQREEQAREAFDEVLNLETEGRIQVAGSHPDPLVRRLVIETTWLGGPWMLDALRALAELTPEDPWVVAQLARAEESAAKRAEERRRFAIGAEIRDFTAETLDGQSVRLADVRAESKVVLVEFWASWCGPCRVEIPHMKEAYARYRDQGFEIVSFTIDDEREDWQQASEEEDLPWFDLGMGQDADAPQAYGVTGVPKNYLVDSRTGDILARDLRGYDLDEKLKEVFN